MTATRLSTIPGTEPRVYTHTSGGFCLYTEVHASFILGGGRAHNLMRRKGGAGLLSGMSLMPNVPSLIKHPISGVDQLVIKHLKSGVDQLVIKHPISGVDQLVIKHPISRSGVERLVIKHPISGVERLFIKHGNSHPIQ